MSNFEEEQQVENLKRWWSENWLALVVGLAVGFAAIGGWSAYKTHRETRALEAARMYDDLKTALVGEKEAEAMAIADKLAADYDKSPYASSAALAMARHAADHERWDEASARLAWVREHGTDRGLRQLAALRLAQVQWQSDKSDEALATLADDAGDYGALYEELRGDIELARGNRDAARSAYEKALAAGDAEAANRELLQQKLDDLAVEGEKAAS